MAFRLPVRRFFQGTEKTETPQIRFGVVQWVLTRPMYRFRRFDLAQVPARNRLQALHLELAQWTPFADSEYYVGWHDQQALVWGWDAAQVNQAIAAQGLKPQRVRILPESVLQTPVGKGLCLTHCHEGYEGQLWRDGQLDRSRWWPQPPTQDEWLMFQRDAGILPDEQQGQPPAVRASLMNDHPWVSEAESSDEKAAQIERVAVAAGVLLLSAPTFWYGFSLYKTDSGIEQLQQQQAELRRQAEPIIRARNEALDLQARIAALHALSPYPGQLELMETIAEALPKDDSSLKEWDFRQGRLKVTVSSKNAISTTDLISALQQTGAFSDVKALPGGDAGNVTFQMDVVGGGAS